MTREVKRGDIYRVNWDPSRGSEQKGTRPALVIQNNIGNTYSPTTIVAIITTSMNKTYPFTVPVTIKESGLPRNSMVNLAAILTIDKNRLTEKCGALNSNKMAEIDTAIKASLALD